jgi:hypothetical protein
MRPQVLDQLGFSCLEQFPVYADRMPNQLLAFLRLARLQDPALFAKVSPRLAAPAGAWPGLPWHGMAWHGMAAASACAGHRAAARLPSTPPQTPKPHPKPYTANPAGRHMPQLTPTPTPTPMPPMPPTPPHPLLLQVSFDRDLVLSQLNEYEILQLLMGDCRERLQVGAGRPRRASARGKSAPGCTTAVPRAPGRSSSQPWARAWRPCCPVCDAGCSRRRALGC